MATTEPNAPIEHAPSEAPPPTLMLAVAEFIAPYEDENDGEPDSDSG